MSIRKIDGVLVDADTIDGVNEADLTKPAQVTTAISDHALISDAHHSIPKIPKIKLETRDFTAASGNVSYTGYGFQPTGLIIFSYRIGLSIGSSEPARGIKCLYEDWDGSLGHSITYIIYIPQSAAQVQRASVASYDVDGFTLTWTKDGEPTGTGTFTVFAFK